MIVKTLEFPDGVNVPMPEIEDELKRNPIPDVLGELDKQPFGKVWLVWVINMETKEAELRAVTSTRKLAYQYAIGEKAMNFDRLRNGFNEHIFVDVEERETNHSFGCTMRGTLGAELAKSHPSMKRLAEWEEKRSV